MEASDLQGHCADLCLGAQGWLNEDGGLDSVDAPLPAQAVVMVIITIVVIVILIVIIIIVIVIVIVVVIVIVILIVIVTVITEDFAGCCSLLALVAEFSCLAACGSRGSQFDSGTAGPATRAGGQC